MEKRKRASDSPPPSSPDPPRPYRHRFAPCAATTPPPPPCLDASGSAASTHEPPLDPAGPPCAPLPPEAPIRRLPLDLALQILSWLPARAIIRCRSVCAAWDAAVRGDAALASAHFERSFAAESRGNEELPSSFLVQTPTGALYAAQLLPNHTTTTTGVATLSPPSSTFGSGESWDVLDSCDGLLLLRGLYSGLILYNPMTRDHLSLPPPPASPSHVSAFSVAFDPSRKGYKVVMLRNHRVVGDFKVQLLAHVCSTMAGAEEGRGRHDPPHWRSIGCVREGETMLNIFPDGVRVNGRLHWLTAVVGCPGISSFDPIDERLQEVPTRKLDALQTEACDWRLTKLNGCLTMLRFHGRGCCEGWVMARYGDDESWSMRFSFTMPEKPMSDIRKSRVVLPIEGGRVFLAVVRGHVVAIDTETQQWRHVFGTPPPDSNNRASSHGCLRFKFLPFVGSLVTPHV